MDDFYDCDMGVRREVEAIFEERYRKQQELEHKLLFQRDDEESEDESYVEEIQERRLDRLISKLFHCGGEEPIKLPPASRPRVGHRGFLPVGAPDAVVAGNNAFVQSHVLCAKCIRMRTLVSSKWEDITCKYKDMTDEEWFERGCGDT